MAGEPGKAKPNPAHFALAKLDQKLQDRLFLCTQNVDDLHEQAGSMRVLHMHGELFKSRLRLMHLTAISRHHHLRSPD
jgi:NAD-dependent SIR2 family protein deacetylase